MGRIDVILPDDLEKKFKKKIHDTVGMKKGNIKKIMIKIIEEWCN